MIFQSLWFIFFIFDRELLPTRRLLNQEFLVDMLKSPLQRLYCRHRKLVNRFSVAANIKKSPCQIILFLKSSDNMKQPAAILVLQYWYTILVIPVFYQYLPVSAILVQILVNTSIPVSFRIFYLRPVIPVSWPAASYYPNHHWPSPFTPFSRWLPLIQNGDIFILHGFTYCSFTVIFIIVWPFCGIFLYN